MRIATRKHNIARDVMIMRNQGNALPVRFIFPSVFSLICLSLTLSFYIFVFLVVQFSLSLPLPKNVL
jgi:hypothetical protein